MSETSGAASREAEELAPRRARGGRLLSLAPRLLAVVLAGSLAAVVIVNWDRWVGGAGAQWTDDATLKADLTPLAAQVAGRIKAVQSPTTSTCGPATCWWRSTTRRSGRSSTRPRPTSPPRRRRSPISRRRNCLQGANIAAARGAVGGQPGDRDAQPAGGGAAAQAARDPDRRHRAGGRAVRRRVAPIGRAGDAVFGRARGRASGSSRCSTPRRRSSPPRSRRRRRRASWPRSISAIPASPRRRTAWSGSAGCIPASMSGSAPRSSPWCRCSICTSSPNYKETQLTHLRARAAGGGARSITFPGVTLRGHVASWSPATGSQFALLPPDNATGNFTKVVQRLSVKMRARRRRRARRPAAPRHVGRDGHPHR